MYGNVARISGQAERRASYTQSSTSEAAKEEGPFSTPDILLPSASANGPVHSPSRTPPAPPAPSSLVDRPQKKRGKLPKPTTDFLKDWLHRHSDHPYPSEDEKKQLCAATGLSMSQVSNWMINVSLTSAISTPRSHVWLSLGSPTDTCTRTSTVVWTSHNPSSSVPARSLWSLDKHITPSSVHAY